MFRVVDISNHPGPIKTLSQESTPPGLRPARPIVDDDDSGMASRGERRQRMRYGVGHKEQTRAKILRAAGRVFRRLGYHASGVDRVMQEAGLTAGGFYAHFGSKERLLAESLVPTADDVDLNLRPQVEHGHGHGDTNGNGNGNGTASRFGSGRDEVRALIDAYLSTAHRDAPETGCPIPALVSEVGRASEPIKGSFEVIVRDFVARIEALRGDVPPDGRALAIVALCIGGVGVARSVRDDDFSRSILDACRTLAHDTLVAD